MTDKALLTLVIGLSMLTSWGCTHSKEMVKRRLGADSDGLSVICAGGVAPDWQGPNHCKPAVGVRAWVAAEREFPFDVDIAAAESRVGSPGFPDLETSLANQIANAYLLKAFTANGGVSFKCAQEGASLPQSLTRQFGHNSATIALLARSSMTAEIKAGVTAAVNNLGVNLSADVLGDISAQLVSSLNSSNQRQGKILWATLTFSGQLPSSSEAGAYSGCYTEAGTNDSLITGVSGFLITNYSANSEWISEQMVAAALKASGASDQEIIKSSAGIAAAIRSTVEQRGNLKLFSSTAQFVPTWLSFNRVAH